MTSTKKTGLSSHSLHNQNCYYYLKELKLDPFLQVLEHLLEIEQMKVFTKAADLRPYLSHVKKMERYDPNIPFGDIYKLLLDYIDNQYNIVLLYQACEDDKKKKAELDDFFLSFYENDNRNLERTAKIIEHLTLNKKTDSPNLQHAIADHLKDDDKLMINRETITPAQAEGLFARAGAVVSDNYKPQHTTSIPAKRHYEWNKNSPKKEIRHGTQAQIVNGKVQISPLYEHNLQIANERKPKNQTYTHVYINNLGRNRHGIEGEREQGLTLALENLKDRHPNIAVITLPADKGLMEHDEYLDIEPKYDITRIKDEFLAIAQEESIFYKNKQPITDFHISLNVRKRLFDEQGKNQEEELQKLINKSFVELSLDETKKLSPAQKQALWFHFIKHSLTSYIIENLEGPEAELTVNFTCKDAIDRGGIASAYFNLMNSFDSDNPMSRLEFECALHAAPAMVKGRGMNGHINILWNTIDGYVNANYKNLKSDPKKLWLIQWRDVNCPRERLQNLLQVRVKQLKHDLCMGENHKNSPAIDQGLTILSNIEKQAQENLSSQHLLLEVATLTPAIIFAPTEDTMNKYDQIADNFTINFPECVIIAGFMKSLIGLIICAMSFGKYSGIFKEGIAAIKTGFEYDNRNALQSTMKTRLKDIRDIQELVSDEDIRIDLHK